MSLFTWSTERLGIMAALLGLCLYGAEPMAQDGSRAIVLRGASIIDGVSDEPRRGFSVVIQDDAIHSIILDKEALPRGAEVIDLEGKYIIPGLIDSHVHWLDWMGELFLNHGVTSIVALTEFEPERRDESQSSTAVPRLYHSGDRPDYGDDDTPEEIRRAMEEWLRREPAMAHFNTYNDRSARAYKVAADFARREGYLVFGHTENAVASIRDGHDVIEHVWGFTQAAMTEEELRSFQAGEHLTWATFMTGRWNRLQPIIEEAVEAGAYLNPTILYEWGGMSTGAGPRELEEYRVGSHPDLVYYPDNIKASLLAKHRQIKNFSSRYENLPYIDKLPEADRASFEEGYRNVQEFIRRWVGAGGKIQAGTDTVSGGMPGLVLHQEMQMLVEAGLTPMQALKSATRWSAELLEGRQGALGPAGVGSLEPGKQADLVILNADPLADIRNTLAIDRVMKNGQWLEGGYTPEYYTFTRPSRAIAGSTFAPVISGVTPAAVVAGSPGPRVTLEGSGFQMTSLIRVNGIGVRTDFINPRRLEFDLPASVIARPTPNPYSAPGPYQNTGIVGHKAVEIQVYTPPPEGGLSNPINLMVLPE